MAFAVDTLFYRIFSSTWMMSDFLILKDFHGTFERRKFWKMYAFLPIIILTMNFHLGFWTVLSYLFFLNCIFFFIYPSFVRGYPRTIMTLLLFIYSSVIGNMTLISILPFQSFSCLGLFSSIFLHFLCTSCRKTFLLFSCLFRSFFAIQLY